MNQIIINGCSFVAGHHGDTKSTLGHHLQELTGKEVKNLAVHGGCNGRTFRTTFDYLKSNKITNSLVVVGLTHWARIELYNAKDKLFYPINFWGNDFKEIIKHTLDNTEAQYLNEEIKVIKDQDYGTGINFIKEWDEAFLKKFIVFYLSGFMNESVEKQKLEREVELLDCFCRENNNILVSFNSLDGVSSRYTHPSFFRIKEYHNWLDLINESQDFHSDPGFIGHPSTQSNLEIAKLILNHYEIRNRH